MLPLLDHKEVEDEEKIFGESYDSEDQDEISEHPNSEILEHQYGSEDDQSQEQPPKILLREMDKQRDASGMSS